MPNIPRRSQYIPCTLKTLISESGCKCIVRITIIKEKTTASSGKPDSFLIRSSFSCGSPGISASPDRHSAKVQRIPKNVRLSIPILGCRQQPKEASFQGYWDLDLERIPVWFLPSFLTASSQKRIKILGLAMTKILL